MVADAAPYLVALGINDLPHVWSVVEPLLARGCEDSRGEFTVDAILAQMGLHDGVERWRLLAIIREGVPQAVMVVCITQMPGGRVLDCLLAAGDDHKSWPLVDEDFDAFARKHGCTRLRIPCARKGWPRALPHWEIRGYVMEREL